MKPEPLKGKVTSIGKLAFAEDLSMQEICCKKLFLGDDVASAMEWFKKQLIEEFYGDVKKRKGIYNLIDEAFADVVERKIETIHGKWEVKPNVTIRK